MNRHSDKGTKNIARMMGLIMLLMLSGAVLWSTRARTAVSDSQSSQWHDGAGLRVRAGLSQTKVIQGENGKIYLKIDIEGGDKHDDASSRQPTDFVVVLDRSGSMMERNKMDYAHQAIESLLRQMGGHDRFALIAFDDVAETPVELTPVSPRNLSVLFSKVRSILPRGGTNLGEGLERGIALFKNTSREAGRARRILLLSDGLANVGVVSVEDLSRRADAAVSGEFAVSTIGLGLDFNHTLMSALADHGLGNYHFLETTASLDSVLAKEFYGAGDVVANNIEIRLNLASGMKIIDASGYPVDNKGGQFIIRPGHVYKKQSRTLYVTIQVPTGSVYSESLGRADLVYRVNESERELNIIDEKTLVACVAPERRDEAKDSIDKEIFEQAWTQNNYGKFLKDSSKNIASGDAAGALGVLQGYKADLEEAYDAAPSPAMKAKIAEVEKKEDEIRDAFTGSDADEKQKRLSKSQHAIGGGLQR